MLQNFTIALMCLGALGILYQSVVFVMQTIPENFGQNPGFGCYEAMVAPWFLAFCIGLGLFMQSWIWGAAVFIPGMFLFGALAMLLGSLFGDRH